jgi:fatty acid desaturase
MAMEQFQYPEEEWFQCDVDRKELKTLTRRSDLAGLLHVGSFAVFLIATGLLAYAAVGTGWVIPAFLLYAWVYCFAEVIVHECAHGTPFKSRWLNEAVYWVASVMMFRETLVYRWSHVRHHTQTYFLAVDYEVQLPRPLNPLRFLGEFFGGWVRAYGSFASIGQHALSIVSKGARDFVPQSEHKKMIRNARITLALYIAVAVWAIAAESWLPLLFFFLPRLFGDIFLEICAMTQHAGLGNDVKDHRFTTRTVYLGPILRFLYWNMNYHIEHHMFPMVPAQSLSRLHHAIASELPPTKGVWGAWKEMLHTFWRQQHDPSYFFTPQVPQPRAAQAPAATA